MRINHAYERALEKPSYRIFANSICVSLPVITLQDGLSEKEKVILRLIRKKGTAARSILEQESGMGRDAVIRVLNELLKRKYNCQKRKGKRHKVRGTVAEPKDYALSLLFKIYKSSIIHSVTDGALHRAAIRKL